VLRHATTPFVENGEIVSYSDTLSINKKLIFVMQIAAVGSA
jgi:hypothetical protein